MANDYVGVRDYLRGLGLDNNQIGWNQQTGMVQYGGKDILKPTENVNGKTYASVSDIMNAVNSNNLMPQQTQYNTSINNLLSQLTNSISQPATYDYKSDPAYKAAKKAAARNAETASRNAMETMNERGILNSTVTSDRLGQIEQDAAQSVTDLIPSLMQNYYNQQQNQNSNLLNLLGVYQNLNQQETQNSQWNQQFDLQKQQYQSELQQNEQYMALQQQEFSLKQKQQDIDNAIMRLNTLGYADNETAKVFGIKAGTPSAQARQTAEELKNRLQVERIQAGNRIAAIEKEYELRAQEKASADNSNIAYANAYAELYNQINTGTARSWLQANKEGLINDIGPEAYVNLVKEFNVYDAKDKNNKSYGVSLENYGG